MVAALALRFQPLMLAKDAFIVCVQDIATTVLLALAPVQSVVMGLLVLGRGRCMRLKGCSDHLMASVSDNFMLVLVLLPSLEVLALCCGLVHDLVVTLIAEVEVGGSARPGLNWLLVGGMITFPVCLILYLVMLPFCL